MSIKNIHTSIIPIFTKDVLYVYYSFKYIILMYSTLSQK